VVIALSVVAGRQAEGPKPGLSVNRLVPWFITGFLILALLRSLGAIPEAMLQIVMPVATLLTVISMAALGLGVDLKVLGTVGGRVTLAVSLSLLVLIAISLGLIRLLGIA
ncbi:MAG: putative sulfate exporter family transporter, partial [Microvirga sp.]